MRTLSAIIKAFCSGPGEARLLHGVATLRRGTVKPMVTAIALVLALPFLQTSSGTESKPTARQRLDRIREEVRAAHTAGDAVAL